MDPPPIYPEWEYRSSRGEKRIQTSYSNPGEVIGRVYYIRREPPSFWSDIAGWIISGRYFDGSSTNRYYSLTSILFILVGIIAFLAIETSIHFVSKRIDYLRTERDQQENRKNTLEKALSDWKSLYNNISGQIKELNQTLAETSEQSGIESIQNKIDRKELYQQEVLNKIDLLKQEISSYQESIFSYQEQIEYLQQRINILGRNRSEISQERDRQSRRIQSLHQTIDNLQSRNQELSSENKYKDFITRELGQENDDLKSENESLGNRIRQLENNLTQIWQSETESETISTTHYNLSNISLALVGGSPHVREGVISHLSSEFDLLSYTVIPPKSERNTSYQELRDKLRNYSYVAIVTPYIDHSIFNQIKSLQSRQQIYGSVVYINSSGRSGIVRGILSKIFNL